MMKNKFLKYFVSVSLSYFLFTTPAFAAGLENPLGFDTVWGLLASFLPVIGGLGGIALLGYLLYGAYLWMSSADQPDKLESAKKTLTNAVIGFALFGVMVGLFFFLSFILEIDWLDIAGGVVTNPVP